jgi:hypothetical protein
MIKDIKKRFKELQKEETKYSFAFLEIYYRNEMSRINIYFEIESKQTIFEYTFKNKFKTSEKQEVFGVLEKIKINKFSDYSKIMKYFLKMGIYVLKEICFKKTEGTGYLEFDYGSRESMLSGSKNVDLFVYEALRHFEERKKDKI